MSNKTVTEINEGTKNMSNEELIAVAVPKTNKGANMPNTEKPISTELIQPVKSMSQDVFLALVAHDCANLRLG